MSDRRNILAYGQDYRRGPWIREKVMGKGAFGSVLLWRNEDTGEHVCIKECHGIELSDRQKTQWQTECSIMQRLRHPNVVRGLATPPDLNTGMNGIPVLALEYCQAGDLRRVLNKAENSVGLPEVQVYTVARDISLAVEYLHSKSVVHRDLKPENIVMKPLSNGKFQYKLIDLGYAKDVSQDSLCKSFVGTEQYLAPELFVSAYNPGEAYSNNVDYWCLGTTVFECITGFRPFFHGIPALQWLRYVGEKNTDQICGILNLDNEVVFSRHIPVPNHLCKHSISMFESWFRLMLMYHPDKRGGGMINGRPNCFQQLETMLKINILHVYNVQTNRMLSHPIDEQITLSELFQQIRQSSRTLPDCEFIATNGIHLPGDKVAVRCCTSQDEPSMVFLVPSQPCSFNYMIRAQPELVHYIMTSPDNSSKMPYDIVKRGYSHFVYYVLTLNEDYKRLVQVQKALNVYLVSVKKDLTRERNLVSSLLGELHTRVDFFNESLEIDLKKHNTLKSTVIFPNKMATFWAQTQGQASRILQIEDEVKQLSKQCESLELKILELNKVSPNRNENFGQAWEEKIIDIFEKFRRMAKEERGRSFNHSEIIKCTGDFLGEHTKYISLVYEQISNLLQYKYQVNILAPGIMAMKDKLINAKDKIITFQKQRQNDIWDLFSNMHKPVDEVDSLCMPPNQMFEVSSMPTSGTTFKQSSTTPNSFDQNNTSNTMQSNSSMVIDVASEESLSLRHESLRSHHRLRETISSLQQSFIKNVPTPDWSFLEQEDSMQE